MAEPLVSIFLPTHARFQSGLMPKAVESVLAQSYRNFEFFIIDDASTDGSEGYLRRIAAQDTRVTYIKHEQNVGLPAVTLAQAYLKSRGQLIAYVFDDTEWLPDHLDTLLAEFEKHPDAAMIYGSVHVELPEAAPVLQGGEFNMGKLEADNYLGNSGVMLARTTIERVGFYDPHILVKRTCDWDLWLRIGKQQLPVYHSAKIIAVEKGVTQADSLGTSVTMYRELTCKYQQTDRNHLLSPEQISSGETPSFSPAAWMNEQEQEQLCLLTFEHFIRTRQIAKAIKISHQWASPEAPITAEEYSKSTKETDDMVLILAFNKYLENTKYACKNTCTSAFKLHNLTHRYNHLIEEHRLLSEEHHTLDTAHHNLLRSLSWKITKPLREMRMLSHRH